MKKIILCGCSLGASWMPYFGRRVLSDNRGIIPSANTDNWTKIENFEDTEVTTIQQAACGNGVFLNVLLNYFLTDDIRDKTIVVGFTAITRNTFVINGDGVKDKADYDNPVNVAFKGKNAINNLTDANEWYTTQGYWYDWTIDADGNRAHDNSVWAGLNHKGINFSSDYDFSSLVSLLCMLSAQGAKVYAFKGWNGVCDKSVWSKAQQLFNRAGVISTDIGYVDLATTISKKEDDWRDEFHPDVELGTKTFDLIWKELNAHR